MDDVTFLILKLVVSIATALVTSYLIPYLKSKTKVKQQEEIIGVIEVAAKAAEQTLEGSAVKKAAVVNYASKWLGERGIKLSEDQIDKLVESVVYSITNENQTINS